MGFLLLRNSAVSLGMRESELIWEGVALGRGHD